MNLSFMMSISVVICRDQRVRKVRRVFRDSRETRYTLVHLSLPLCLVQCEVCLMCPTFYLRVNAACNHSQRPVD